MTHGSLAAYLPCPCPLPSAVWLSRSVCPILIMSAGTHLAENSEGEGAVIRVRNDLRDSAATSQAAWSCGRACCCWSCGAHHGAQAEGAPRLSSARVGEALSASRRLLPSKLLQGELKHSLSSLLI